MSYQLFFEVSACNMFQRFTVLNEVNREYRRFEARGRELTVQVMAPPQHSVEARDIARYFAESVDELFEYALRDLDPGDMVGVSIHTADNRQDRPIGLSFRRRDQISREERVRESDAI
jgi:hypothetical protein